MAVMNLPRRSELAKEYTWNLESIYSDDLKWEKDFELIGEALPAIEAYRGRLAESAQMLLGAFKKLDELEIRAEQLSVYASMRKDEDNTNSTYQAFEDRAQSMITQFSSATSFIVPEITAMPAGKLADFIQAEPGLEIYRHFFDQIAREKLHIRSAEVEEALALAGDLADGPSTIYRMLTVADLKFPVVSTGEGDEVELTHGRFVDMLTNPNREVRREVYEKYYTTFAKYANTIGSTFAASIKKDIFYARTHNYKSALEAALSPHNIPLEVYNNLVDTVNANVGLLHRYISLRKKLLGIDQLKMYDIYTPLIPDAKRKITYPEATETVKRALSILGEDYVQEVDRGIKSRWIDVYENAGKTGGAYSSGSYTTQPFILLNYQDNLDNMFTLAHELGHSLHSLYTNRTQPHIYANYSIFVAEVASTTNEALLTDYLLKQTDDKAVRTYLVNSELDKFRSTLFRQTMFAEFERETHARAEAGEALTPDLLNTIYADLHRRYYGPDIETDELISREWMRIPHFYSAFYVYQYSTGISAAAALSRQMLDEGAPAIARYRQFLTTGSSDYPTNLLTKAGVDMTSPRPVQLALDYFGKLLDQMEELTA